MPSSQPPRAPGPTPQDAQSLERRLKVLEAFRSVAVGFEKDLLASGAREVALLLGSARQAAEETLARADRDGWH